MLKVKIKIQLTGHAFIVLTLREANHATTPGCVLVGLAVGVRSAGHIVAWIDATALDTGEVVIAVVVGRALLLGHGSTSADAARAVWIARAAARALAHVATLGVEAVGASAARIVHALVNVGTAVLRVAFVARLAHALGRVGRCALCVHSAWEAVAWI